MATKETVTLKKGAVQFVDEKGFAAVKFAAGDTDKKTPQLDMLAYSGGIIPGHWYWGDLAIDLQGMKFPKKKFPILEDHRTEKKIGFATKMVIDNNQLTVGESEFIDTPESLAFRDNSSQGFPYEASIFARPMKIQRLMEGEVAMVNGFEMKGPGTIWRTSTFKEVSICTFGYDSNTRAAAMSEGEEEQCEISVEGSNKFNSKEELISMDHLKFKADHPEEYAKLVEIIQGEVTVKFAGEKSALEAQVATLTEQNTKLSEENKGNEVRLQSLEKAEMLRTEAALKHSATVVFDKLFAATELPVRLSEKIRKLVDHEKFIKDGSLDKDAFTAAVELELKDWTAVSSEEGSVLGFGASSKGNEEFDDKLNSDQEKLCDATAARMAGYCK
jgi:hypothetical protein